MKNNFLLLVMALPLMFLLTGCPYNSKLPLSAVPITPIDKALVGEWISDKEPNDSSTLKIYEFNKNEYAVIIVDKSDRKTTVDYYRAFLSPVGGKLLLNLESLKAKGEFNFCDYVVEGNTLKVRVVSDVSVKENYETSKALAKAFAGKINNKDFFESKLVFVRKK